MTVFLFLDVILCDTGTAGADVTITLPVVSTLSESSGTSMRSFVISFFNFVSPVIANVFHYFQIFHDR